jgi:hypothetical protein
LKLIFGVQQRAALFLSGDIALTLRSAFRIADPKANATKSGKMAG